MGTKQRTLFIVGLVLVSASLLASPSLARAMPYPGHVAISNDRTGEGCEGGVNMTYAPLAADVPFQLTVRTLADCSADIYRQDLSGQVLGPSGTVHAAWVDTGFCFGGCTILHSLDSTVIYSTLEQCPQPGGQVSWSTGASFGHLSTENCQVVWYRNFAGLDCSATCIEMWDTWTGGTANGRAICDIVGRAWTSPGSTPESRSSSCFFTSEPIQLTGSFDNSVGVLIGSVAAGQTAELLVHV